MTFNPSPSSPGSSWVHRLLGPLITTLLISSAMAGPTPQQEFAAAFNAFQAGQLEAAIQGFESGLKREPNNALAHFFLAQTLERQGTQSARAKTEYEQSLKLGLAGEQAEQARQRLAGVAPANVAKVASLPTAGTVFRDCDTCPEMVVVPAGQFIMGSPPSEMGRSDQESPTHLVKIDRPMAVGKFEVTYLQWRDCVKDKGCREDVAVSTQGQGPVSSVSYEAAVAYTEWLSDKTGRKYRLLSEAEWEYAARAGSDRARYWGSGLERACQFENSFDQKAKKTGVAGFGDAIDCDDGHEKLAPVGSFKPNAFGLHDMLGNVSEWVEDCWNASYEGAPTDGSAWGTGDCTKRVMRGGHWHGGAQSMRSAHRTPQDPKKGFSDAGFRLGRELVGGESLKQFDGKAEQAALKSFNEQMDLLAQEQARKKAEAEQAAAASIAAGMIKLNAGTFSMGNSSWGGGYDAEKPAHEVNVPAFEMGRYEVTQGQWKAVMGSNPSHFSSCGDNCPVESVSWDDIQVFLQKLNSASGKQYRLPSEAEWEYACRAGGQDEYCGSNSVDAVTWYDGNSGNKTHTVGQKQANAWGLYDMSGNVREWTADCWHDGYRGAPSDGSAWIGSCTQRVFRGGGWYDGALNVRSANRYDNSTAGRDSVLGFRLARTLP